MLGSRVTLFGIPFSIYNGQQLYQVSCDLLEEPALYTMFFVTGDQCRQIAEAKRLQKNMERICWIPGDSAVQSIVPKRYRHLAEDCSIRQYILKMCEYATDMGLDVCVLMDDEESLKTVFDNIRKVYPYLQLHGWSFEKAKTSENIVNEINSVAPEILILGVNSGELRHYVERGRWMTNARLCICVGEGLLDEMTKKKKWFHNITMSRTLKRHLRKYNKREQKE